MANENEDVQAGVEMADKTAVDAKSKKEKDAKRKKLGKAQEEEEALKAKGSEKNSKKVDELDKIVQLQEAEISLEREKIAAEKQKISAASNASRVEKAVYDNNAGVLEEWIQKGDNCDETDDIGRSLLKRACALGNLDVATVLMQQGGWQNSFEERQDCLLVACSWGRWNVVRELILAEADCSSKYDWIVSPLAAAAQHGHLKVIKLLCESQADVNGIDQEMNDPWEVAWNNMHSECVFFLVSSGATIKKQGDWERLIESPMTALQIAQGIYKRDAGRLDEMNKAGKLHLAKAEDYMASIQIPMTAFCMWLEEVPAAAVVLLDKVLLRVAFGGTDVRCAMAGKKCITSYIPTRRYDPDGQHGKAFAALCPDTQTGKMSRTEVRCMHHEGALTEEVFFSLAITSTYLFKSEAIEALVDYAWNSIIATRYHIVAIHQLATIVMLWVWALVMQDEIELQMGEVTAVLIAFQIISDIFEMIRQHKHFKENASVMQFNARWHSATGVSLVRMVRILAVLVFFALYIIGLTSDNSDHGKNMYRAAAAFIAFERWVGFMQTIRLYESLSSVLPIMKTFGYVGPFFSGVFLIYIALIQALSTFQAYSLQDLMLYRYRLDFLLDIDWDKDMNRDLSESDTHYVLQTIWTFFTIFLLSIALMNVLVAIIGQAYEGLEEKHRELYLEEKTHVVFSYFCAMNAGWNAPFEKMLQMTSKTLFPVPTDDAYLWCCYDKERVNADEVGNEGRNTCAFIRKTVKTTYNQAADMVYRKCAGMEAKTRGRADQTRIGIRNRNRKIGDLVQQTSKLYDLHIAHRRSELV